MPALTCHQVKPAGTVETLTCELCHQPFEHTHDGKWMPASCPTCRDLWLARMGGYEPSDRELKTIDEIMKILEE